MTKANLKKAITKMIEDKYPSDEPVVWDGQDIAMFDYYFATLGKENELCAENTSILFSKGGYTTEVSVENWNVLSVTVEETGERIH